MRRARKKRAKVLLFFELCKYFCNFLIKKVFLLSKPCIYAKFIVILHAKCVRACWRSDR